MSWGLSLPLSLSLSLQLSLYLFFSLRFQPILFLPVLALRLTTPSLRKKHHLWNGSSTQDEGCSCYLYIPISFFRYEMPLSIYSKYRTSIHVLHKNKTATTINFDRWLLREHFIEMVLAGLCLFWYNCKYKTEKHFCQGSIVFNTKWLIVWGMCEMIFTFATRKG